MGQETTGKGKTEKLSENSGLREAIALKRDEIKSINYDQIDAAVKTRDYLPNFAKAENIETVVAVGKYLAQEMIARAEGSRRDAVEIQATTAAEAVKKVARNNSEREAELNILANKPTYTTLDSNGIVILSQRGRAAFGLLNLLWNNSSDDENFNKVLAMLGRNLGIGNASIDGTISNAGMAQVVNHLFNGEDKLLSPDQDIRETMLRWRDLAIVLDRLQTNAGQNFTISIGTQDLKAVASDPVGIEHAIMKLFTQTYAMDYATVHRAMVLAFKDYTARAGQKEQQKTASEYFQHRVIYSALMNNEANFRRFETMMWMNKSGYREDDMSRDKKAISESIRNLGYLHNMARSGLLDLAIQSAGDGSENLMKEFAVFFQEPFKKEGLTPAEGRRLDQAFQRFVVAISSSKFHEDFLNGLAPDQLSQLRNVEQQKLLKKEEIAEALKLLSKAASEIFENAKDQSAEAGEIRKKQTEELMYRANFTADLAKSGVFYQDMKKDAMLFNLIQSLSLKVSPLFSDKALSDKAHGLIGSIVGGQNGLQIQSKLKDYRLDASKSMAKISNDGKSQLENLELSLTTGGLLTLGEILKSESENDNDTLRKFAFLYSSFVKLEELSSKPITKLNAMLKMPQLSDEVRKAAETLVKSLEGQDIDAIKTAAAEFVKVAGKSEESGLAKTEVESLDELIQNVTKAVGLSTSLLDEIRRFGTETIRENGVDRRIKFDLIASRLVEWQSKKSKHDQVAKLADDMNADFKGVLRFDNKLKPETDPDKPQFYGLNIHLEIKEQESIKNISPVRLAELRKDPEKLKKLESDTTLLVVRQIDYLEGFNPNLYEQAVEDGKKIMIAKRSLLGQYVEGTLMGLVRGQKISKTGAPERILEEVQKRMLQEGVQNSVSGSANVSEVLDRLVHTIFLSHEGEHVNQKSDPDFIKMTSDIQSTGERNASFAPDEAGKSEAREIATLAERFMVELTAHLRSAFEKIGGQEADPWAALFVMYQLYTYLSASEEQHYKEVGRYIYEQLAENVNAYYKTISPDAAPVFRGRLFKDYTPEDLILRAMKVEETNKGFLKDAMKKIFISVYDPKNNFSDKALDIAKSYVTTMRGSRSKMANMKSSTELTARDQAVIQRRQVEWVKYLKDGMNGAPEATAAQPEGARLREIVAGLQAKGITINDAVLTQAAYRLAKYEVMENVSSYEIKKRLEEDAENTNDIVQFIDPSAAVKFSHRVKEVDEAERKEYESQVKSGGPIFYDLNGASIDYQSIEGRIGFVPKSKAKNVDKFRSAHGFFADVMGISIIFFEDEKAQTVDEEREYMTSVITHEANHMSRVGFYDTDMDEGFNEKTRQAAGGKPMNRVYEGEMNRVDELQAKYHLTDAELLAAHYRGDTGIFKQSVFLKDVEDQLEGLMRKASVAGQFDAQEEEYEIRIGDMDHGQPVKYDALKDMIKKLTSTQGGKRLRVRIELKESRDGDKEKSIIVIVPVNGRIDYAAYFHELKADRMDLMPWVESEWTDVQKLEREAKELQAEADRYTRKKDVTAADGQDLLKRLEDKQTALLGLQGIDTRSDAYVSAISAIASAYSSIVKKAKDSAELYARIELLRGAMKSIKALGFNDRHQILTNLRSSLAYKAAELDMQNAGQTEDQIHEAFKGDNFKDKIKSYEKAVGQVFGAVSADAKPETKRLEDKLLNLEWKDGQIVQVVREDNKHMLVYKTTEDKKKALKRVYLYVESKFHKGEIVPTEDLDKISVDIAGDDYLAIDVAEVFNRAIALGYQLKDEENETLKVLTDPINSGALKQGLEYSASENVAVLAVAFDLAANKGERYFRDTVRHEMGHGDYMTNPALREAVDNILANKNSDAPMSEELLGVFVGLKAELGYDVIGKKPVEPSRTASDVEKTTYKNELAKYSLFATEFHAYFRNIKALARDLERIPRKKRQDLLTKIPNGYLAKLATALRAFESIPTGPQPQGTPNGARLAEGSRLGTEPAKLKTAKDLLPVPTFEPSAHVAVIPGSFAVAPQPATEEEYLEAINKQGGFELGMAKLMEATATASGLIIYHESLLNDEALALLSRLPDGVKKNMRLLASFKEAGDRLADRGIQVITATDWASLKSQLAGVPVVTLAMTDRKGLETLAGGVLADKEFSGRLSVVSGKVHQDLQSKGKGVYEIYAPYQAMKSDKKASFIGKQDEFSEQFRRLSATWKSLIEFVKSPWEILKNFYQSMHAAAVSA